MKNTLEKPASGEWRVYLLDGLRLTCAGQPVSLPPFRSQSLLAALLLRPAPGSRSMLAGLLYPDSSESAARARLSDHLYHLRRSLPGFPFVFTPSEIAIDFAGLWVDVLHFRSLLAQGQPAGLLAAVELYRGDLLPEQSDEWLLVERENLRLSFTHLLQNLSAQALARADYAQAIPLLERLQQVEPYDESHLRSLLRAYQATGQRGVALAAFERYRVLAQAEMGLPPEDATLALVKAIQGMWQVTLPVGVAAGLPDLPDDLARRGILALWQGDFSTLQACLNVLPPGSAADSLQAAWDILRGDFSAARQRLDAYPPEPPLEIELQRIHLAAELKQFTGLVERCKSALAEADRRRDTLCAALLLIDMGLAYQRQGQMNEALRCANQAINQSEKAGLAYPLAEGWQLKANLQVAQGFERDALETYHCAAAYAAEHGFLPLLARIEGRLGICYQNSGKYRLSLHHYQRALHSMHDLGMRRYEAETLHNRGIVYDSLGWHAEASAAHHQARKLFAILEDEQGMARNDYHIAFSEAYREDGDLDQALALGQQALTVFEAHASLDWIASLHHMLGYLHWLRNEPEEAILSCQRAIPIYQQLEEADCIPELYAYIGLAYLQKDEPAQALEFTTRAMDEMLRSELYDIASEIFYAHATVLAALGREDEADAYFSRGYENLLAYAAEVEDPDARGAIFRRDPTIRRLMAEVYRRGIAPPPGRQPPADAPAAMPNGMADDHPSPALKHAQGPLAQRRSRLARLLNEACRSGRRISTRQIAALLGVSPRTVERDIALLRERGELPHD